MHPAGTLYDIREPVADPDPGFGVVLIPVSGIGKNPDLGSGIRDKHPVSYFRDLSFNFLG
jgi:hypothetical protein